MPIERSKEKDYKPLSSAAKGGGVDQSPLRPSGAGSEATASEPQNLINLSDSYGENTRGTSGRYVSGAPSDPDETNETSETATRDATVIAVELPQSAKPTQKAARKARQEEKDQRMLGQDRWLARNGHFFTYVGLYLFSIMVLFRPYEIVPGLGFLSGTAVFFALVTLAIYLPSQLAAEGNLTIFPTEVKAILAMTLIALLSIPIAKDPGLAWEKFNDPYIKAVVIFIVLINVVRTRQRLMGIMWLSFGIGIYLGIAALDLYLKGQFAVEEYRIAVDVGGMFGNPNEMAMHFVMMTPIVIALGIATRGIIWKAVYFGMAGLFVAANMVTFSRGGFLGLIACLLVLAWKVGRKYRLNVTIASILVGGIAMAAAPGNYGLRMLSIFIPGLDAVGSSDQRQELLIRSLWVTARNPWGIGIGAADRTERHQVVLERGARRLCARKGLDEEGGRLAAPGGAHQRRPDPRPAGVQGLLPARVQCQPADRHADTQHRHLRQPVAVAEHVHRHW